MAYIGNQTATAFTSFDKQIITGNNGTVYTLSHAVANEQEIEVFVNNVRQEGGAGKAFTVSGNQITFTGSVTSNDSCYVNFQGKALQTVVPPDGSVGTAKIANGSVTDAKITAMAASKLTGSVASAAMPTGSVIQVVQNLMTVRFHISTTGEKTITGATVTITPKSTSSKILVTTSLCSISYNPQTIRFNLYRDSTVVNKLGHYSDGNNWAPFVVAFNYLDSPATTSQITYQVKGQIESAGNGVYINYGNNTFGGTDDSRSTLTAMEIAG